MEDAIITGADTTADADTDTAGAGGDFVLPQLALGLGAVYSAGRLYDNIRFWNEYHKNTGHYPKYPFRSGAFDWMGYASDAGFNYHLLKRL